MSKKNQTPKTVNIVARYFIKRNGAVVYQVRSSNGQDTYTTTLINGHATGCSCPAVKPCYHMTQLEQREQERGTAVANARRVRLEAEAEVARIADEAEAMMKKTDEARGPIGHRGSLSSNRPFSILR